jgi:RNA polymerase sigma-70 factor, ECF subfamily
MGPIIGWRSISLNRQIGGESLDKNGSFVCHIPSEVTKAVSLEELKFTTRSVKELYEKHGSALAAYGCCCGLDFGSAEDVVQQVFLNLLQKGVPTAQIPLAYLYRAVRNASLNYRRDHRREVEMPQEDLWLTHATADRVEVLALQSAIKKLPEEQMEVLFFRIWSGMTLQEIAEATGTPINTVASRYRYALEKLRERLAKGSSQERKRNAG